MNINKASLTHVVSVDDEFDDVAGVGGQRADGRFRNEVFQLLKRDARVEKVNN